MSLVRLTGLVFFGKVSDVYILFIFLTFFSSRADAQGFSSSPWPMFGQGPGHTSRGDVSIQTAWKLKWKYKQNGGLFLHAIGIDGTIYMSSDSSVTAINPEGTLKWKFKTAGGPGWSSPAVGADGTVYIGTNDSLLYAINQNGTLKWTYKTGGKIYSFTTIGYDGTIYIRSFDSRVYAVNPDGTLKWKSMPFFSCEGVGVGMDNTVYAFTYDRIVYAFNTDGTIRWTCDTGPKKDFGIYHLPVIANDGTIYVLLNSFGYLRQGYVVAIAPDGTIKWEHETTGNHDGFTLAVGADGTVYTRSLEDADFYLIAINPDGSLKWRYQTSLIPMSSQITVGGDGCIYLGVYYNSFYDRILAINPDGTLRKKFILDGCPISIAIGSDGTLYCSTGSCLFYALAPETPFAVAEHPAAVTVKEPRPNPFNPSTIIEYSLPAPSRVKLEVFAVTGQKAAVLADGPVGAGTHSVTFDGSRYASGLYFYRFESAGTVRTGKMILLK
jgi:outer membrane protein assembly factor BamB